MDLLINIHSASGKTTWDLQWTVSEMEVEVLLFAELKLSYMPFMVVCLHLWLNAYKTSTDQSQTKGEMAGMEVTVPEK